MYDITFRKIYLGVQILLINMESTEFQKRSEKSNITIFTRHKTSNTNHINISKYLFLVSARAKYVGVILDETLTWSPFIKMLRITWWHT